MSYRTDHLQSVECLLGVGPHTAELLRKKGICTIEDLLLTLPLRYEDRRVITPIADLVEGAKATVRGVVRKNTAYGGRGRLRRRVVRLRDESGEMQAAWFGWGGQDFAPGENVILTGEVKVYRDSKQMQNPEASAVHNDEPPRGVLPVYSETEGMRQRTWRKLIAHALGRCAAGWLGAVPEDLAREQDLLSVEQALRLLHEPADDVDPETLLEPGNKPLASLIFEEMLVFQLGLGIRRQQNDMQDGIAYDLDRANLVDFYEALPFSLTRSQSQCAEVILTDMTSPIPMHQLIHGDVGSGKTVLAMLAAYVAARNGWQTAIMAPTDVLAQQHQARFKDVFDKLGIRTALISAALDARLRRRLEEGAAIGLESIVIGTHALLSGSVTFHRLGLVIVDEQHKFGVGQRAALVAKGPCPDVLVLSATPIPRSMALTVFGDLDVVRLDEKPGGRGTVVTELVPTSRRDEAYARLAERLRGGGQAYVVCPRLNATDDSVLDVHSLSRELSVGALAEFRLGILHGRMNPAARMQTIEEFHRGDLDVLVATTIIEVGVDVPQAVALLVENAERFGLSQLHQLRGRVGRGAGEGICLLVFDDQCAESARKRLEIMAHENDGFVIAEEDLRTRGPGELLGLRQHGVPPLRFAQFSMNDLRLLEKSREAARDMLVRDPTLAAPEHQWAKMVVTQRWGAMLDGGRTG